MPKVDEAANTDGASQEYWMGLGRGEIMLQRCGNCGHVRHYPRLLCNRCHSFAVDSVPASGRGKVHSWTVTHHMFDPTVCGDVPFALVTVDLEEGVRVLGRFVEVDQLRPDLPVRVEVRPSPEGQHIFVFVPETANASPHQPQ